MPNTLEEQWQNFSQTLHFLTEPLSMTDLHMVFYAGSGSMLSQMINLPDIDDIEKEATCIKGWDQEFRDYIEKYIKERRSEQHVTQCSDRETRDNPASIPGRAHPDTYGRTRENEENDQRTEIRKFD